MKELTPRDGAPIPKSENLSDQEREFQAEMDAMVKDERHALAVLAKASAQTAESNEEIVTLLQEVKDILVLQCKAMSVALPAYIAKSIADGDYNPDEGPDDQDEDEEAAEAGPV